MIYINLLQKILQEGNFINRKFSLLSLYNYNLELNKNNLENIINLISLEKKNKFKKEFELFLSGEINIKEYKKNNINYWDYLGNKFINSYPNYYPNFNKIKENIIPNSKNLVLYLGDNNYSNQQSCISTIQFQEVNKELYISVLQRSCDVNLGFFSDLYHLFLFSKELKFSIKNLNILYGNIHIYINNILETKRYIMEGGNNPPYHFIQNNKKR